EAQRGVWRGINVLFSDSRPSLPAWWPQHIDLPLPAALQRDGVQLATLTGFDIQRDQLQPWAIVRRRLQLGIGQCTVRRFVASKPHRRGDETLHQVALRRANIRFKHVYPRLAQATLEVHQLAVMPAVKAQHRAMVEIAQRKRSQFDTLLAAERSL